MALSMVEAMRDFAKQGKTVISTIHQPSSQIFEKFDTLILLAEGRVAYIGPSKDAVQFFEKLLHFYNFK
jgi:ABC-type multidrug transport system ATPase subunit